MIIDHISNYSKYAKLHSAFEEALKFINNLDHDFRGGFTIRDQELYGSVNDVTAHNKSKAKFECHKQYIDIQFIVEGFDLIGWGNIDDNTPGTEYNAEKDYRFVNIDASSWIHVPQDHFVIFFPEDAHAPMCGDNELTKVFMKVKVD